MLEADQVRFQQLNAWCHTTQELVMSRIQNPRQRGNLNLPTDDNIRPICWAALKCKIGRLLWCVWKLCWHFRNLTYETMFSFFTRVQLTKVICKHILSSERMHEQTIPLPWFWKSWSPVVASKFLQEWFRPFPHCCLDISTSDPDSWACRIQFPSYINHKKTNFSKKIMTTISKG